MKKLLLILAFIISTVFVNEVSALSYVEDVGESRYYMAHQWVGNDSANGNNCYYIGWFNKNYDITISNYTITSGTNITYYKICDYDNFIEFLDTGDSSLLEAATTNKDSMSLNTDSSYMMYSNFDLIDENGDIYFAKNEYTGSNYNNLIQFVGGYDWNFKKYYGAYLDLDSQKAYIYGSSNWNSPTKTLSLTNYPYWIAWETTYSQICYSSSPFYYDTSTNEYKTGGTFKCGQSNLSFDSETSYNYNLTYNSDYEFETSHDIYTQDGVLYNESTINNETPTIEITKSKETSVTILDKVYVTDVTLKIDFGTIDNDKYLYMYKYGSDSEWSTITLTQSNSFTKTYSENNTLYVQVLSKNDNSVVTSSTYTISSINYDLTPYITVEEITEDGCIMGDYILCQSLRINSHIADFNRYKFILIDHVQNLTEEFKEMTIYKTYYMNTSVEVRIVDRTTGEYVDIKSFTIATVSEETENLGQYIKQDCKFASIGSNYLCDYYFYNYDPDKYNYYYGTSTKNFEELFLENGTQSAFAKTIYKIKDGLGKLKEVSYGENTTVYFKIIDKETSEIIYTKTFTISYDLKLEESGKENIFDIFNDFKDENSSIKNLLEEIWIGIKNCSIYEYILILIVGTLIVLIIKAANR